MTIPILENLSYIMMISHRIMRRAPLQRRDIISPTSIYLANFQETKLEELVERLYHLYNRTVFENKLPVKMDILWCKRLTSASGQCWQKLENNRCFSVIELMKTSVILPCDYDPPLCARCAMLPVG